MAASDSAPTFRIWFGEHSYALVKAESEESALKKIRSNKRSRVTKIEKR